MSLNTWVITKLLLGALILSSCNPVCQTSDVNQPPFYVLRGKEAEKLVWHCSGDFTRGVEGYWTPSESELQKLTATLNHHLNSFSSDLKLLDYTRQYAGTIKSGRKLIFVNGFNKILGEKMASDLDTQAFAGCGGGAMIYGLEYDVETQSLQNFAFNPER